MAQVEVASCATTVDSSPPFLHIYIYRVYASLALGLCAHFKLFLFEQGATFSAFSRVFHTHTHAVSLLRMQIIAECCFSQLIIVVAVAAELLLLLLSCCCCCCVVAGCVVAGC